MKIVCAFTPDKPKTGCELEATGWLAATLNLPYTVEWPTLQNATSTAKQKQPNNLFVVVIAKILKTYTTHQQM